MKEKDNLSILIETLLKIIKEYSLMETSDGKYDIHLKKESESTFDKSYELIINDKKWNAFQEIK